jgi:light-regulated signal transduction histidine kinase (bacteriophytochrome)
VPLKDENGRAVGLVGISRDITDIKQAEEVLKLYASKLEHSNKELEQFAYIASHDLQEPLRKVTAFGDRLKARYGEALDERGLDYLTRMQSAATRMQRLIDALLTYSRVTTKAQPFEPVNLSQIANEIISDLEIRIEQVAGQVKIGNLPTIDADPTQMRQLMQNLLSNALKFHKPDQPPIVELQAQLLNGHTRPTSDPAAATFCRLTVQDNGIGFDEKHADRIFQVFQRLHGRGEYEGSGVGLAICRRIVERHNGTITATSGDGQGATFTITLPIEQSEDGNHAYEAINMYGRRS